MIIVPVKDGESIEKSLKKFKKKIEKTGMVRELRDRQKFTKPSVVKRMQKIKAVYVQKLHQTEENS
ncbi:MAG: 30S ribosomal protein S21 [Bacteroidetes bacterium]|jgi:small subunit ribosomal protein S21|nr:30S ribosomal protein S21 [Bacteroidota bacterium]